MMLKDQVAVVTGTGQALWFGNTSGIAVIRRPSTNPA